MSRLQEHEAKALVARYGVPVPQGRLCRSREAVSIALDELGPPVYVKAQVRIGDRKAVDAVRRADDRDEALAHAADLLDADVAGQRVEGVLVERVAPPGPELYLSVAISELHRRRRLAIARAGGSGFDVAGADAELLIDPRAAAVPMYALRKLLRGLGFEGPRLVALAAIAHGLVRCAIECHAYTVELNPVIAGEQGPVAVDAKVELDDYAAGLRPPDVLAQEAGSDRELRAAAVQRADHRGTFRYVQMLDEREIPGRGAVGTHSVGGGESLVVLDALESVELVAANYCDTSGSPSREKVAAAAELIAGQPGIAGYFFSSCIANQPLSVTAAGLTAGFEVAGWRGPTVVRIAGNEEDEARAIVSGWAAEHGVDARVFGREVDEWAAARAMSELLRDGAGRSG